MANVYSKQFKSKLTRMVVDQHFSTIKTAEKFNVPLKTLENWITAYRKDPDYFNKGKRDSDRYKRKKEAHQYDRLTRKDLITECKIRDSQIKFLQSLLATYETN